MISYSTYQFCGEDIRLIENFEKALLDRKTVWDVHHRLEIELNKTGQELKEAGLYYNRPASELIFLTKSEHSSLHRDNQPKRIGFFKPCTYMTPDGDIRHMQRGAATRWHPDWTLIE